MHRTSNYYHKTNEAANIKLLFINLTCFAAAESFIKYSDELQENLYFFVLNRDRTNVYCFSIRIQIIGSLFHSLFL